MSASRPVFRAGCSANATTASCCSSTCATTMASPRSCSTLEPVLQDGRGGAQRERDPVTGKVVAREGATVNPQLAPARSNSTPPRCRAVDGRDVPIPVFAEHDEPEELRLQVPLPRPAQGQDAQEHHAAHQVIASHPPAHDRAGFMEFQTPILTAEPRGRARLSGAKPPPSRQVLCAAAGAAAVQAAPDGRRASTAISRSRPASATRMRAPTARPASSTSSTSR